MTTIIVKNLSKQFQIGVTSDKTLINKIVSTISGIEKRKPFWALKDISFTAETGEIVGIVGPNGAGKSTLFNIISGIYQRFDGEVSISGKVVSATGIVSGLQDRLTMHDNIYICTALYGLSRKKTKKLEASIISFADLEEFSETKLFQFSSGMVARLVFSIAIHVNPSILLLDEVTSNLDKNFTEIVTKTVHKLKKQGVVVLVVSHKKEIIEQCDKVLYIEKGRQKMYSTSDEVIGVYF